MKSLLIAAHSDREKELLEHIEKLAVELKLKVTVLPDDLQGNLPKSMPVENINSTHSKRASMTSYRDE